MSKLEERPSSAVEEQLVTCPNCGSKNLFNASDCVKCNMALPTFDALTNKPLDKTETHAIERPTGIIGTIVTAAGAIMTFVAFFFAPWVTVGPLNSIGGSKTGIQLTGLLTQFAADGNTVVLEGSSAGWKLWVTPVWCVAILGFVVLGYVNKRVVKNLRTLSFIAGIVGVAALWLMLYTVDSVVMYDPVIYTQGWKLSLYAENGLLMAIIGMILIFLGRFYIVIEITNRRVALLKADKIAYAGREITQAEAIWLRFRKHRLALIGLIMMSILLFLVIFSGWLAPYDPKAQDPNIAASFPSAAQADFTPPTIDHWLGTDTAERDIFSRELYAGRVSLIVGFATILMSCLFGMLIGSVAGYYGKWVDSLLMRITDIVLSFPTLPLLLVIAGMLQQYELHVPPATKGVIVVIGVLTVLSWMGIARLIRGQILSLRNLDYVEASRALGASPAHIIIKHLLPNSFAPIIVTATLGMGDVILTEAYLSFLGVGIQDNDAPTWGNMVSNYVEHIELHPYYFFIPGAAIFLVVLSINFIGDGLRDALDPRQRV